jgi:adenine-specific DNA-methyltransferase
MGTKPTRAKANDAKLTSANGQAKNEVKTGLDKVADYRFDRAKRKNNPPAKIAAEGTVPLMPKITYEYSPRLAPVLRFDPTGGPDKLPELLAEAQLRALTASEAKELAEALRKQEPWLEWAEKREKRRFQIDPVALHIHERVSPQAILRVAARQDVEPFLFADPQQQYHEAVQFYRHEIPWTNRLILGDSMQVMTSLSRREDLAGKVQMIYMDPPYGIKFASNFQPEVGKRDVKDKEQDLTREPEMVKAYRDTWHLGIHSYLSYLRDRLVVAKEMLADSGSIFVQIGDENLHRIRDVLDEVFGNENFVSVITVWKTSSATSTLLPPTCDYLIWYAKDRAKAKYRLGTELSSCTKRTSTFLRATMELAFDGVNVAACDDQKRPGDPDFLSLRSYSLSAKYTIAV